METRRSYLYLEKKVEFLNIPFNFHDVPRKPPSTYEMSKNSLK